MANRDDDLFGRSGGRNRGRDIWYGGDPDRGTGVWNEGYRTSRYREEDYSRGPRDGFDYDDEFHGSTEGYAGGGYMGGDWSRGEREDRDESDPGDRGSGRFEQGGGYLGGNYRGGSTRRGGGYFGSAYDGERQQTTDRGYDRDRNRMRSEAPRGDYGRYDRDPSGRGDFETFTRPFSEMPDRGRQGMSGEFSSPSAPGWTQARRRESFRGRGPLGYTRSDERVEDDLNRMLTEDDHVDASDIEVKVSNGEVTLSGFVSSRDEKRRAEDIAERCFGVKDVTNQIRVRHQHDESDARESTRSQAKEPLRSSPRQGAADPTRRNGADIGSLPDKGNDRNE